MKKALELLKTVKDFCIDYSFNIENDFDEAISELEVLIEKDKSKKCEECYKETNRVLTLVEQRESDAKNTTIKLIKEIEELNSRSCESCKHYKQSSYQIYKTCFLIKTNGFNLESNKDFYCSEWESK